MQSAPWLGDSTWMLCVDTRCLSSQQINKLTLGSGSAGRPVGARLEVGVVEWGTCVDVFWRGESLSWRS